ncbi:DUF2163 domain-containing protein [Devosia sp. ZB163]|uniref:DUF2163 domain-containing protein n=1 Tax=Devosia sp. ZB163 TaxID=3025938 RepID=UPI00235E54D7|nr:DUF2163 domain-containing protein [Devosia sp. ZB163]MDC9823830.1 DUF2163 domain-containing protein [Devosia sp. ZB163]
MRALEAGFAAHIASGATTLATCWRIVRSDGLVLGFTDHDVALAFGDTQYLPAHGLDGGERTGKLGASVDTTEVAGVLHSDAISEEDILLGRFDGAEVETWRVNWRDVNQRVLLGRATIGEIVREDGVFRAELRSGQHAINQPKGRIYQALCDAELGDARCRVNLDDQDYRAEAAVVGVRDRFRIVIGGIEGFEPGWFAFGVAAWGSGRREGLRDRVVTHERLGGVDVLGFGSAVGEWVDAADQLVLTAGCDRRFATCRERFGNVANFRGFPHIPGTDFVLRYPREGAVMDGRTLVG